MRIIDTFERTIGAGEDLVLNLCKNKAGDTVVSEVYIDVPANTSISVSASVDGETWHVAKVMDMGNLTVVQSISTKGYYMLAAAGLSKAKLTFTTAGSVVIKETF